MIFQQEDSEIQEMGRFLYIKRNSTKEKEFKDVLNRLLVYFVAPERIKDYETGTLQLSKKAPETLQLFIEYVTHKEVHTVPLNIDQWSLEFDIRNLWSNKKIAFKYDSFRKKDLDAFIELGLLSQPFPREVLFNTPKVETCKEYFLYVKNVLNAKSMQELSNIKSLYEHYSKRHRILRDILEDAKRKYNQNPSFRQLARMVEVHLRFEEYDEALEFADKGITTYPHNPEAWTGKGLVLENMGELDKALLCYEEAIKLDPDGYWANFDKGNILKAQERYQEAIDHWSALETKYPKDERILINKGVAFRELGNFDEAVACLEKVLSISPRQTNALFVMGTIRREQRLYEEALIFFNKLLNKLPADIEAKYLVGLTLQNLMRDQEAILYLEYVKSKKPHHLAAWLHLGISYAKLLQLGDALNCFDTVLLSIPNQIDALILKGHTFNKLQDWASAEQCFLKALSQDEANVKAYEGLIRSLRGLQRYKDAEFYLYKLVELDPDSTYALNISLNADFDEEPDVANEIELFPEGSGFMFFPSFRQISEEELENYCRYEQCDLCPKRPFCKSDNTKYIRF